MRIFSDSGSFTPWAELPSTEGAAADPWQVPGARTGDWEKELQGTAVGSPAWGLHALWARCWDMAVGIDSPGHSGACPLPYTQDLWCCGKNASPAIRHDWFKPWLGIY